MSCGANAAFHFGDAFSTREEEGYPVAVFDPGVTGLSNVIVHAKYMKELGPEPFGGVHTADELKVINGCLRGVSIDLSGLFHGCMILPQHEECVGVGPEAREKAQRGTRSVYGYRSGAGGIHGDGSDGPCCCGSGLLQTVFDRRFEAFDIVEGVLSETVVGGIAELPVFPAGIIKGGGGNFGTVGCVDQEGSDGIRAIIYSYHKVFSHMVSCEFLSK
jgi:hypothetical protein